MTTSRRALTLDYAIALLAVAVPLVYLSHDLLDASTGNVDMHVADVAAVLAALACAALIARAARAVAAVPSLRSPWRWLALGAACNAVAEIGWALLDVVHPDGNLPQWVHIPYFAAYLPLALGLLAMPPRLRERRELLKFWLDALVVVVAGSMAVYYFVVYPLLTDVSTPLLERVVAVGYPVGDLVLLLGTAAVLLREPPRAIVAPLYLLVAGVALQLIGDVVFTSLQVTRDYQAGMLTDLFWLFAYLLMGLSALWQRHALLAGRVPCERAAEARSRSMLPYISVAYAYVLLGWVAIQQRAGVLSGMIVGAAGLSALVVVRQVIVIVENRRLAVERDAQQSRKLEAISRLAGGVAHDFNNLLTAIQGNTQLLLDGEGDAANGHTELLEIARASEMAAGLTRQLLAFDRRHQGRSETLELNALLRELSGELRKLIGPDRRIELDQGSTAWVTVNRSQLEQVVLNLAANAGHATGERGRITIAARSLVLDERDARAFGATARAGYWSVLTVSDDGCGMSAETLEHVFEPFFTTRAASGARGLGLATAHNVITQYGGWLTVRSKPGRGATFELALPAVAAPKRGSASTAMPPSTATVPAITTVLVAEDEAPVRELVRRVLERKGFTVLLAENGAVALELASAHPFDLLLTDVSMPEMSGTELARRLREQRPHLPILFMSGYSDDAVLWADVRGAAAGFLQKPFSPTDLVEALRQTASAAAAA